MARIIDFNINNQRHLPSGTNSCSVVINNNQNTKNDGNPQYPEQVMYNPPVDQGFQSVSPI